MNEPLLTDLQAEILEGLICGKTQTEVAKHRGTTRQAVHASVKAIRKKLNVKTDIQLGAWAHRNRCMPDQR